MLLEKISTNFSYNNNKYIQFFVKTLIVNIILVIIFTISAISANKAYFTELIKLIEKSLLIFLFIIFLGLLCLLVSGIIALILDYFYDDDDKLRNSMRKVFAFLIILLIIGFIIGSTWIYIFIIPDFPIILNPFNLGNSNNLLNMIIFFWWYAIFVISVITILLVFFIVSAH
jgi:hypothetical protein